ncbi:MAG: TIGR01244 family sulfur transferase [Cellvibrionaceae bacterium]
MDAKKINDALTVSGQISLDDITALKSVGVKSIVCNRPDNEDPGQLTHQSLEQAAKEQGLVFYFMPVISGQVTMDNGIEFDELINKLPQPIHAYCRSGTRCTTLWALGQLKQGEDKNKILAQAKQAGYDLSKTI